jgi:hypothetical protein
MLAKTEMRRTEPWTFGFDIRTIAVIVLPAEELSAGSTMESSEVNLAP